MIDEKDIEKVKKFLLRRINKMRGTWSLFFENPHAIDIVECPHDTAHLDENDIGGRKFLESSVIKPVVCVRFTPDAYDTGVHLVKTMLVPVEDAKCARIVKQDNKHPVESLFLKKHPEGLCLDRSYTQNKSIFITMPDESLEEVLVKADLEDVDEEEE